MKAKFDWEIYSEWVTTVDMNKLEKFYVNCKGIDGFENVKLDISAENEITDITVENEYAEFDGENFAIELAKIVNNGEIRLYFGESGYNVSSMQVTPLFIAWMENEEDVIYLDSEIDSE